MSNENNKMKFLIEGTTPSFINSIRRISTVEVPTMAIEEVAFTKNSSVLYDEMLALRLGLIPLSTDLKTYKKKADCKCAGKGCNSCQAKLTLNAKGPGIVYSGELKSKDPKIKPVIEDIPIVKLAEHQELKLTATAELGTGREHAKWTTGNIIYQGQPEIKIVSGKHKDAAEIVAVCPKKVLEVKDGTVKVKNLDACNLCRACQEKSPDVITVNGSTENFIVSIESWGQLSPKDILLESASIMSDKLKEFNKLIK